MHRTTPLAELTDDRESKSLLVETNGARQIAHVQRGFKDAVRFGAHRSLHPDFLTVSEFQREAFGAQEHSCAVASGERLVMRVMPRLQKLVSSERLVPQDRACTENFAEAGPIVALPGYAGLIGS
jgi:hypothetical protein